MNKEAIRHCLETHLSGYHAAPRNLDAVIARLAAEADATASHHAPRLRRLAAVGLLALALLATVTTAYATGGFSQVLEWLRLRSDVTRLGDAVIQSAAQAPVTLGQTTFRVTEAFTDGYGFFCGVEVTAENGQVLPLPDTADTPLDPAVSYVRVIVRCDGIEQELFTATKGEDGTLSLLCEGFCPPDSAGVMEATFAVTQGGNTEEANIPIPCQVLPVLKRAVLKHPLPLGDTGYTLDRLTLVQTTLRTYVDWHASLENQPLAYALQHPELCLVDDQGHEITRSWPYDAGMPSTLTVQVWSRARTECLYETRLTENDWKEE